MATLNETLALAQAAGRICPQPQRRNDLYQILPNTKRIGSGWEPPLPLILGAWRETPDLFKALRLRKHIEWANQQGAIDVVFSFLSGSPENEWHHAGK
jgi:hypothetical protein